MDQHLPLIAISLTVSFVRVCVCFWGSGKGFEEQDGGNCLYIYICMYVFGSLPAK